jgi:outer membrane murein-binding lipoprotein Lpp
MPRFPFPSPLRAHVVRNVNKAIAPVRALRASGASLGRGTPELALRARYDALVALAILGLLAGCATTEPTPSATIDPEPTGNAEMDRMLSMLQQVDAMEDDSIDLEAMAARSPAAADAAADAASNSDPSPATDLASNQDANPARVQLTANESSNHPQGEDARTIGDDPDASLYAHPFALPNDRDEPDPFEAQLAQFNAPPGLLGQDAEAAPPEEDQHDTIPPAQRLADAIRDQGAQSDPFTAALAKAAVAPLVGLAPDADPSLTAEATGITDAVFTLLTDLSSLGSDPDPDEAAALARSFADDLNEDRPLEITAAALCSRVDGFGRYNAFHTPKFLSGRAARVVVYVEIDHFSHAPLTSNYRGPNQSDAPQWEVRLSQEINLYRANETVPVWTLPASTLTDISRNKRRDFHVTNQITLPATLALGMYKLKVTMRDLVSGAQAEKTIAIQIVTDPGLLSTN